jgi:TetR/AcrR family transcriptional regulator, ethionamide resistance regulator
VTAQGTEAAEPRERTYTRAESAVLAATEELLRERPLNELSVADIIERAGISRTSFYVYFASKTAVIAECLRRVMHEVHAAVEPLLSGTASDLEEATRVSVERWLALATVHGALLRAVSEEWPHDEEIRRLWFAMMDASTDGAALVLRRARRRGQAPPGADPQALAACLMWASERVLHVALVGEAEGIPDPEAMVVPLTQLMVGGLFGRPLSARASRRR